MLLRPGMAACLALWCGPAAGAQLPQPPARTATPLRYQWRVGDRLVYERRVVVRRLDDGRELRRAAEQIQLWCLAREAGQYLCLVDLTPVGAGARQPRRGALLYLDRRGRRRVPELEQTRLAGLDAALEIIPELRRASEPGPGWTSAADLYGRRWRCTRAGADARFGGQVRVDFVMEDPTGVAGFLGRAHAGSFWFNPQLGLLTRLAARRRDRQAGRQSEALTVLRLSRHYPPGWCARRALEARDFLRTLRQEQRYLQQIVDKPAQLERTLERLGRLWEEFLVGLHRERPSPFRQLGIARSRRLASQQRRWQQRAWLGRRWLGRVAAEWSLQDPGGRTIGSESLRGQYVLECFWSASSLWSLRALETMRRLLRELAGRPLRVVCLNLDRDVELARRAARQCASGLTTLLVGPPLVGAAPPELPAFRLLDRRGRVLKVFVGWRPSLAAEVAPLLRD